MAVSREKVIEDLRPCLVISKDPIPGNAINGDFKGMTGKPIPFAELGYPSLRAFLESEASFVVTTNRDGQWAVSARRSEADAHLSSLVARTKTKRKGNKVRKRGQPSIAPRPHRPTDRPTARPTTSRPQQYFTPPVFLGRVIPGLLVEPPRRPPPRQPLNLAARLGNPPIIPQRVSLEDVPVRRTPATQPESRPQRHVEEVGGRPLNVTIHNSTPKSNGIPNPPKSNGVGTPKSNGIPNPPKSNGVGTPKSNGIPNPPKSNGVGAHKSNDTPPNKDGTLGQRVQRSVIKWLASGHSTSRQKPVEERKSDKMASENTPASRATPAARNTPFQTELEQLAQELAFPKPSIKINQRKPTKGKPLYSAVVYVGDCSFNSFPDERETVEEAEELAAQKACINFRKRIELLKGSDSAPQTSPWQEALTRIAEMLEGKSNGIFSDHVEEEYLKKYGLRLPAYWREEGVARFVFECDLLSGNRFILYPLSPEVREEKLQDLLSKHVGKASTNGSCTPAESEPDPERRPSAGSSRQEIGELEKLELPAANTWDVFVTTASSPASVWVRLVGDSYDGLYDAVMNDMEMSMMDYKEEAPRPIVVNKYYAVYLDKCWLRAQVTEILDSANGEEEMVDILLIDNGDIDTVPVSSLYLMEPTYTLLAAQAIPCRLAFAEVIGEDSSATATLLEQVGKSFVADVVERANDDRDHSIILYDTSVDPPENINLKLLTEAVEQLAPPKLPAKDRVTDLRVGSIAVGGPVYVYMQTEGLQWVEQILEDLASSKRINVADEARPKHQHLRLPRPDVLFLAKSADAPDQWRRAVVVKASDDLRMVEVFFVDYGIVETVATPNILLLSEVFPPLCRIPKQAIRVQLFGVRSHEITPEVVALVKKLAPPDRPVLARVVEAGGEDQLPVLSLFVKLPPDGILVRINDNVSLFPPELTTDLKTETRPERPVSRSERERPESRNGRLEPKTAKPTSEIASAAQVRVAPVLCRGLSAPPIPEVGKDFFQVQVTMASNPDLFVVQPLSSFQQRQSMMKQLQEDCLNKKLLPPTEIFERNLYAALHDKTWFRVSVVRKGSPSTYTVYLCDFGNMAVVPATNFLCLDEGYKALPYQAIRAKLTGIKPVNVQWSAEDCREFRRKILHEYYHAQVTERAPDLPDLLSCQDSILGVKLLDTQDPTNDVDIADWLCEKGRAVKI